MSDLLARVRGPDLAALAVALIGSLGILTSLAQGSWRYTPDAGVRLGEDVNAASTEAVRFAGSTVRLYAPGIKVFRSADGLNFSQESAATPGGTDSAVVYLPDGSLRMYFVRQIGGSGPPGTGKKQLRSAVSSDGVNWTEEPGLRFEDVGNGVPDVVPLPGGGWRLYYVSSPSSTTTGSGVVSALSTDGMTFTSESGERFPSPYVDPEVTPLDSGNWLAVLSTFTQGVPQTLHLAESVDGLTWSVDPEPLLAVADRNVLDPTFLRLAENRYRIYYSSGPLMNGGPSGGPFQVESGVIEATPPKLLLHRLSRALANVRRSEMMRVRASVSEASGLTLTATAGRKVIAKGSADFTKEATEKVPLELTKAGARKLKGCEKARVKVRGRATNYADLTRKERVTLTLR